MTTRGEVFAPLRDPAHVAGYAIGPVAHPATGEKRQAIFRWMPNSNARSWVDAWRDAGPRLEAIRRGEIRRTDHVNAIALFEGVFEYVTAHLPPDASSGLVEQQRIFARARRSNTSR